MDGDEILLPAHVGSSGQEHVGNSAWLPGYLTGTFRSQIRAPGAATRLFDNTFPPCKKTQPVSVFFLLSPGWAEVIIVPQVMDGGAPAGGPCKEAAGAEGQRSHGGALKELAALEKSHSCLLQHD